MLRHLSSQRLSRLIHITRNAHSSSIGASKTNASTGHVHFIEQSLQLDAPKTASLAKSALPVGTLPVTSAAIEKDCEMPQARLEHEVCRELQLTRRSFADLCVLFSSLLPSLTVDKLMVVFDWMRTKHGAEWRAFDPSLANRLLLKMDPMSAVCRDTLAKCMLDFGGRAAVRVKSLLADRSSFREEKLRGDPYVLLLVLSTRSIGADETLLASIIDQWQLSSDDLKEVTAIGIKSGFLKTGIAYMLLTSISATASASSTPDPLPTIPPRLAPCSNEAIGTTSSLLPEVKPISSKANGIRYIQDSLRSIRNTRLSPIEMQERLERDCISSMAARQQAESALLAKRTGGSSGSYTARVLIGKWHTKLAQVLRKMAARSRVVGESSRLAAASPESADPFQSQGTLVHEWSDDAKGTGYKAAATTVNVSGHDDPTDLLADVTGNPKDADFYLALLGPLSPDIIAAVVLHELLRLTAIDSSLQAYKATTLSIAIGSLLQRELFAAEMSENGFQEMSSLRYAKLNEVFADQKLLEKAMRKVYGELQASEEARLRGWMPAWTTQLKAEVGAFLLHIVSQHLTFDHLPSGQNSLPLIKHEIIQVGSRRRQGVIRLSPLIMPVISDSDRRGLFSEPWAMPMLVPPRPWLTLTSGGYLTHSWHSSVRIKEDPIQRAVLEACTQAGGMDRILEGLDVLGRTPWTINEHVLGVALHLWNDRSTNVATLQRISDVGDFSAAMAYRPKSDFETHAEYVQWVAKAVRTRQEASESHSLLCDTNYKLEIARQFAGKPFYLPHSIDFRGRAYPIPPHLSHTSGDFARGLLCFAEAKPLGERGLYWLKLHLANMYGYDKHSRMERVSWTEEHMEDITAAVADPLNTTWWQRAEEPWQLLAACFELTAALASPDPRLFESRLPVQQDGSCNGLQHYAALGGDIEGAQQVNLAPSDRPQDVYAAVAKLVNERIDRDVAQARAAKGTPDSNTSGSSGKWVAIAEKLQGKVTRKIIKQPVMTKVYGVTKYGARLQIEARLREFGLVPSDDIQQASSYLTSLVMESIRALFVRAQAIQDWLTRTARDIGRAVPDSVARHYGYSDDTLVRTRPGDTESYSTPWLVSRSRPSEVSRYPQTSVMWTTPLGLQVCQPYLHTESFELRTCLQSMSLRKPATLDDPVNESRQTSAFPPNFVHSLDATHMFMTALACYRSAKADGSHSEDRITFASVHDCFWTHASTVDAMNVTLREQFVALYSAPILQQLSEELRARYKGYKIPIVVTRADNGKRSPLEEQHEDEIPTDPTPCPQNSKHSAGTKKTPRRIKGWKELVIADPPPRGSFDLQQVLQSDYFFS